LDIDVARLIADGLKAKAELIPVPSPQRLPWLQERKVDLIVSTLGKTPEREKLIDFCDAYGSFYLMVYGPKAVQITTPADLKGRTIAVSRGTVEDGEITKLAFTGVEVVRFEGNAATLNAYVDGKTQLLAAGTSVVSALALSHPNLDIDSKLTLKEQQVHIGVTKGEDALRERVNAIIKDLKTDGTLRKLSGKWFSRAGMTS
jgi:polar amino acid transport system substrate-binding protein